MISSPNENCNIRAARDNLETPSTSLFNFSRSVQDRRRRFQIKFLLKPKKNNDLSHTEFAFLLFSGIAAPNHLCVRKSENINSRFVLQRGEGVRDFFFSSVLEHGKAVVYILECKRINFGTHKVFVRI